MQDGADGFERSLRLERNRSEHTVRAYLGDVTLLLHYLASQGGEPGLDGLTCGCCGAGWRPCTARARPAPPWPAGPPRPATFTRWAFGQGLLAADVGELLVSPRPHRSIPPVLSQARGRRRHRAARRRGTRAATRPADSGAAVRHRHPGGRAGRAGPGRSRPEPAGAPGHRQGRQATHRALRPAGRAGAATIGCEHGRPAWATPASGPGAAAGQARRPARPAHRPGRGQPRHRRPGRRHTACPRTGCGTPPPPICSTAAPTCGRCRSCSGTPAWPPPRSTPTYRSTGCAQASTKPIRGP